MVGQQIGNYRLVKLLGAGGMGMVYEAVHDGIGGRAAIKVLRPEIASNKDATQRFFSEARAANLIAHPGIVHIFDCGYTSSGTAYLTMEFLEGETLKQRLDRLRVLTVSEAFRIARQVAVALQSAHERSVIHRDLKPDNLMLVRDSELAGGERVKILDFGVAKISEGLGDQTRTGMLMGTPAYMAPEQCREAKLATDRSDVYSLGVILYQCLAGRPPFQGEYAGDVMAMQMMQEPPPLGQFCPWLQAPVAAFVHRLLEKKPAIRPNMEEVVRELQRLHERIVGSQTHIPAAEVRAPASAPPAQRGWRPPAITEALTEEERRRFAPTSLTPQVSPLLAASREPTSVSKSGSAQGSSNTVSLPPTVGAVGPAETTTLSKSNGQLQKRSYRRTVISGLVAGSLVSAVAAMYFVRGTDSVTSESGSTSSRPKKMNTAPHSVVSVSNRPVPPLEQPTASDVSASSSPPASAPDSMDTSSAFAARSPESDSADPVSDTVRPEPWRSVYKLYQSGAYLAAANKGRSCKALGASKYKCPWLVGMSVCQLISSNQDSAARPALNQMLLGAMEELHKQNQMDLFAEVQSCVTKIPSDFETKTPPVQEAKAPAVSIPSELHIPNFETRKPAMTPITP
ncbi:MAG TPA: protein kinase [Pseudomonadota bacterium]|nr:protein kinase [Pseudomonadota bacterium]